MWTEVTLRVVRTTKCRGRPDEDVVIWTGSSVDDLSRAYPPSEVFGADPLERSEVDDGMVVVTFEFQQRMTDRDMWAKIDDPRRRLTPVTTTERAIADENRRLFPGDYVTTDECEFCEGRDCIGDGYCMEEPYD